MTLFDTDTLELLMIYISEWWVSKKVDAVLKVSVDDEDIVDPPALNQSVNEEDELCKVFWDEVWRWIYKKFSKEGNTSDIIQLSLRIGKRLNGYGIIFWQWCIEEENLTSGTLENIFSFFHFLFSLKEKKITEFNDILKVFNFLALIETDECKRRIRILYQEFIESWKVVEAKFDQFKAIVLRYMKNGDEKIIENFLRAESSTAPQWEEDPKLRWYSPKLNWLRFWQVERRLNHFWFFEPSESRGGSVPKWRGWHRYFWNKDGQKITISHHPGDTWLANLRVIMNQLEELIPNFSVTLWNSLK